MEKIKYGGKDGNYTVALCIKDVAAVANNKVMGSYILPLSRLSGMPLANDLCTIPLYYPKTGNLKKKDLVATCTELLDECDTIGIEILLVADGKYFEYLAGVKGLERQTGSIFKCVVPEYEHILIIPVLSYVSLEMYPDKQPLQDKAFARIVAELHGEEIVEETFEFKTYEMVTDPKRAKELLKSVLGVPYIAADIETRATLLPADKIPLQEELDSIDIDSPRGRELRQMLGGKGALALGHTELLTIAFAPTPDTAFTLVLHEMYGVDEAAMHRLLKGFFKEYRGRFLFHNGLFDVKHLVYLLFMEGFNDTIGMREGVNAIKFDDTMLLAYCVLNSTSRISLGLKDLAYDLLGDYAEDMTDATLVPLEDLALYNAKDVAGTWYVFNKYKQALDFRVYQEILEPSCKPVLKMMLNGLPLDLDKVAEVKEKLTASLNDALDTLRNDEYVKEVERRLRAEAAIKYNDTHKRTTRTSSDFKDLHFNPNSGAQLRMLLFDTLGFTPIDVTPKGAGKTDRASIEEFLLEASSGQKPVLEALVSISKTAIVLNTFIHAFEVTSVTQDGQTTLHGNLRLGGTQSNRMSSNNVNLQNMPNTKDIKSCFVAPSGWLFAGSDFNALTYSI